MILHWKSIIKLFKWNFINQGDKL